MARWLRYEPWIFWAIVILNLIPVLGYRFFPTLDGPAHLYNAKLIHAVLGGSNETISQFLEFTSDPVPNWTSHFILTFFSSVFPAWLAEKMVLITYLILLPLGFRKIILAYNPQNVFYTWLVFPFTYNFFFILGFYNFCLSIPFMLLTIAYWKKNKKHLSCWRTWLSLGTLFMATYFSHIFVFTVLLGFIGLDLFITFLQSISKNQWKQVLVTGVKVLLVALPFISMQFIYFYIRPVTENVTYISKEELTDWVYKMRPLLCYDFTKELPYVHLFMYGIIGAAFAALVYFMYRIWSKNEKFSIRQLLGEREFFLVLSIGCMVLYFITPDGDGQVGYVSLRLLLLFFVFTVLWLSMRNSHILIGIAVALVSVYVTYHLRKDNKHVAKELSAQAVLCEEIGKELKPGSVVLPLDYTGHWLMPHFSNYLGIHTPVIILENYEASTGYFPLRWRTENFPDVRLAGEHVSENCLYWVSGNKGKAREIDYVFVMGEMPAAMDSCMMGTRYILTHHFKSVKSMGPFTLYKRK